MTFENLIYMREEMDLSQREIADKLNVSKSTYARWETGENIIPLEHLIDLCNLSNTNLDYALSLTNKKDKLTDKIIINKKLIGENLKKIRIDNNLTQDQLAKILNCSQSVVSEFEAGTTLIQTAFLYEICAKLNLSTNLVIK